MKKTISPILSFIALLLCSGCRSSIKGMMLPTEEWSYQYCTDGNLRVKLPPPFTIDLRPPSHIRYSYEMHFYKFGGLAGTSSLNSITLTSDIGNHLQLLGGRVKKINEQILYVGDIRTTPKMLQVELLIFITDHRQGCAIAVSSLTPAGLSENQEELVGHTHRCALEAIMDSFEVRSASGAWLKPEIAYFY